MTPPRPRLSVVLTGRNDNYGGDFAERLVRTLTFNSRHLVAAGISHEFVLVEWNPIAGKALLIDLIEEQMPAVAAAIHSIVVDGAYHDALTLNPRLSMLEYIAKNVGIRRAAGEFVLSTNTDILLGRGVVSALAGPLGDETLYRVPRIDLNIGTDVSHVDWDALEDVRLHVRRPVLHPPLYSGGTGDFVLLDRVTFHRLRGFNEVYRVTRAGLDYNLLVKAYGVGVTIAALEGAVYHVNHVGSFRLSKHLYRDSPHDAPWGNQRWHSHHVVYENADSWGLGLAHDAALAPGRTSVTFSWTAVPPMLDLKRVVLPARVADGQP